MLYLGIDQHKAQITVNLRNEQGNVVLQRQVSTDHAKMDDCRVDEGWFDLE